MSYTDEKHVLSKETSYATASHRSTEILKLSRLKRNAHTRTKRTTKKEDWPACNKSKKDNVTENAEEHILRMLVT